jgi:hypothetical protein
MRQIRGAPVTVLITMMMLGVEHSTGTQELTRCTGYNDGTVTEALRDLEFLGMVQNHRRYNGWMLTAKARQLPLMQQSLPETEDDDVIEAEAPSSAAQNSHPQNSAENQRSSDSEAEKIRVGSSSYTLSLPESDQSSKKQETTTTNNQQTRAREAGEPEKISLDADAQDAVAELVALGVPKRTRNGRGALDAVETALKGGWSGPRVCDEVADWLAYCETDAGASIKAPGILTAARIRDLQPAPELSSEDRARQYIREQYARAVNG